MQENRETKQIIVVRKDLNMRKGKIAAQVAHASLGAFLKSCEKKGPLSVGLQYNGVFLKDNPMYHWLSGPFTKICVSVDSEEELLAIQKQADELNILNCLITDSGKTEFKGIPTNTCLAIGPWWVEDLNKLTGHLPLL